MSFVTKSRLSSSPANVVWIEVGSSGSSEPEHLYAIVLLKNKCCKFYLEPRINAEKFISRQVFLQIGNFCQFSGSLIWANLILQIWTFREICKIRMPVKLTCSTVMQQSEDGRIVHFLLGSSFLHHYLRASAYEMKRNKHYR